MAKPKPREKEDYGATGRTAKKPSAAPRGGAAPVHRGEDNSAALSDVDAIKPTPRRDDTERPG